MYPSLCMACNISRATKYANVLWIEGCPYKLEEINEVYEKLKGVKDPKQKSVLSDKYKSMTLLNVQFIERAFDRLATPDEDCVSLCNQFFNMPDFDEMNKIFKEYYK